jgi:hypothetical protein
LAGPTSRGKSHVAPLSGTTIAVEWDDMGQKLIEVGAIDLERFQAAGSKNLRHEEHEAYAASR